MNYLSIFGKIGLLAMMFIQATNTSRGQQIADTITYASACDATDGKIELTGNFDTTNNYQVVYHRTGTSNNDTVSLKAKKNTITIDNLRAGVYSHIVIISDGTVSTIKGHKIIYDNCHLLSHQINPSCGLSNGKIEISKLPIGVYNVSYYLDNERETHDITCIDSTLTIPGLRPGTYKDIVLTLINKGDKIKVFPVVLTNNSKDCIGKQSTVFLGAAYENFTGIPDDDPSSFSQVYARLSQPLNKAQGIEKNAAGGKRFIPLRNLMFQLTYGNTDNFKMYSTNFFGTHYVNRLDLYAHSYFNGSININMLTYIMPENWKLHTGDMAHIYLDFFSSLITTNVIDTGISSSPATNKTYNIKSNLMGFTAKASFNKVFNTNFMIEIGTKLFWLNPSSKIVNGSLNPQNSEISGTNDPTLSYVSRSDTATLNGFLVKGKNVPPYYAIEALIQYNTGKTSDNSSNVFLHYQYVTNFAGNRLNNFSSNYWQFQLGYALDIGKIFPSKSSNSSCTDTANKDDLAPSDTLSQNKPKDITGKQSVATKQTLKAMAAATSDTIPYKDTTVMYTFSATRNIRSKPNDTSEEVGQVTSGTQLQITGYTDSGQSVDQIKRWYRIDNDHWFWADHNKALSKSAPKKKKTTTSKTPQTGKSKK